MRTAFLKEEIDALIETHTQDELIDLYFAYRYKLCELLRKESKWTDGMYAIIGRMHVVWETLNDLSVREVKRRAQQR